MDSEVTIAETEEVRKEKMRAKREERLEAIIAKLGELEGEEFKKGTLHYGGLGGHRRRSVLSGHGRDKLMERIKEEAENEYREKREKGKGGKGRFTSPEEAIEEIRKEERKKNIRGLADAGAPALQVIKSSFGDEDDPSYAE